MQAIDKVCPGCGRRFEARVEVCPGCGVPLRWGNESWGGAGGAGARAAGRQLPPLEPSPELAFVRAAEPEWIEALGRRLDRAGIRSFTSLVGDPSVPPEHLGNWTSPERNYYLFVSPDDLEASQEVDRAVLAEQVLPAEDFGGFPTERSDVCPACGAYRSEDADRCPSCELIFRWSDEEPLEESP